MKKCGLLGKKLGHSYSPAIHAKLGNYEYLLYEKTEEELEDFVKNGKWDGLNVTIPYKKMVLPLCDELSETARKMGSVNTLVRKADGKIFGDNTDAPGFSALIRHSGIEVNRKKGLGPRQRRCLSCCLRRSAGDGCQDHHHQPARTGQL